MGRTLNQVYYVRGVLNGSILSKFVFNSFWQFPRHEQMKFSHFQPKVKFMLAPTSITFCFLSILHANSPPYRHTFVIRTHERHGNLVNSHSSLQPKSRSPQKTRFTPFPLPPKHVAPMEAISSLFRTLSDYSPVYIPRGQLISLSTFVAKTTD